MPTSADLQIGDVVVTSGFGNRFPRGLKVAEIESINVSPDRTFQTSVAKPYAQFDRLTEVFLVWPFDSSNNDE